MPGAMVTGFDICRELVDLAPRVPRVRFFCSDSETFLQQNHDTFDLIWICLVLGGIPDEALAPIGQNLYQKLNDGGLVFLIEHLADAGGSALWKHRPLNRYCELFPGIALKKIGTYLDIDSEVSVVAGRKHAPAV
jgi:SAM-dependent methyltransferase